ncbi:MAG: hypothetical protein AB7F96_16485 [Beijerinckiaceae bacterium]
MAKATKTTEVQITALQRGTVRLRIIGTTPMFQNRMPNKVMQILLTGGSKGRPKNTIKHDPLAEYRNSAEILPEGPTALGLRVIAVKAAMCTAALETEGITKTAAQRLLFMPGDFFHLYGVPQLRMDVVRSADVARTPDVRTRCYIPKWGAEVNIHFAFPQMSMLTVMTLLNNAGVLVGVGDYRQDKGKGSFGSFRVVAEGEQDDEWDDLVANHGRQPQLEALESPEYANQDTADLMAFYDDFMLRRAA